MWAPDGHDRNLLSKAIAACVRYLKRLEPGVDCLVCYADPNVGHQGGVYRAASWVYTGRSSEVRYYIGPNNEIAARRRFHSGRKILRKAEIEALGYTEAKLPGKHRFARGLTRRARKELEKKLVLTAGRPSRFPSNTEQGTPEAVETKGD
ncbi:MAG: hypothetical protein GY906_22320 [bacterium]|nr:hypothetical protein [bacterium]